MKQALIVWGGWHGHEPEEVAGILAGLLREEQFEVVISDTLDSYTDEELMAKTDLIVPIWTMGTIEKAQLKGLLTAVERGAGIAGCHGGMSDSFRNEVDYQFMVGGQWVAHPGNDGVKYTVNISDPTHPLMVGIEDFEVVSEQYYMHVDPAITVLATTRFPVVDGPHAVNKPVDMPVVWTKLYGKGRVFHCTLGHVANIVRMPQVLTIMKRGMVWAARDKA